MKHDKEWLTALQQSDITRYFASYAAVPWSPCDDSVVERFYSSMVKETGGIILYDVVHAINAVKGYEYLKISELTPRSKYNPDMIRTQCGQLENGGKMAKFDPQILQQAYNKVRRMFRVGKITPLDLEEVPYEPNSNAGLPTLKKKKEVYPEAVRRARRIRKGMRPQPVAAFHRGKNMERARFVLGYPFEMMLLEGRFFYPYQQAIIKHHTPYAGGRYDFELSGLLNEIRLKSRFICEWDYKQFDSSISELLIRMAFSILKENFVMSKQDMEDWARIVNYFINTPMLFPDGYIYVGKDHGVPSGSTFTQLIDSIVNCIAIEYVCRRERVKPSRYYVLGDDVVIGFDRPVQPETVAPIFKELGINLDTEEKSCLKTSDEDIHFLGHDWSHFIGVRSERETLERLVTPERGRNEYWSNSKEVRTQAYIERCKSYQDDNMRSFPILQELIAFYRAPSQAKRDWNYYCRWLYNFNYFDNFYLPAFNPTEERNEVRWKHNKANISVGKHRGLAALL